MKDIIKRRTTSLYKQTKVKRYVITELGLTKILSLSPRSQQLLLDIIKRINQGYTIDSLTVKVSYVQLGFKNYQNLHRARKEILEQYLMYYKDGMYYVNPCYINYYTRRQSEYFFKFFGLKNDIAVIMLDPARSAS